MHSICFDWQECCASCLPLCWCIQWRHNSATNAFRYCSFSQADLSERMVQICNVKQQQVGLIINSVVYALPIQFSYLCCLWQLCLTGIALAWIFHLLCFLMSELIHRKLKSSNIKIESYNNSSKAKCWKSSHERCWNQSPECKRSLIWLSNYLQVHSLYIQAAIFTSPLNKLYELTWTFFLSYTHMYVLPYPMHTSICHKIYSCRASSSHQEAHWRWFPGMGGKPLQGYYKIHESYVLSFLALRC